MDQIDVERVQALTLSTLEEQSLAVNLQRVELEQEILIAKSYPRSQEIARQKIEENTLEDREAAQECIYTLPRAGKPIKGPSVRFAEIVRNAWGNCRVHARPVLINRQDKMVVAEAAFRDFQSNTTAVATVQRRISTSDGRLFSDDMIIVTMNAACAIAKRNVILESVPRRFWFPIYMMVETAVKGDLFTFAETREKILKSFADFGVKPEQVFKTIGLRGEGDLTIEHIPLLRGMYTALKDGSATVEEMFDPRRHVHLADPGSPNLAQRAKSKARQAGFSPDNVANGLAGQIDAANASEESADEAVEEVAEEGKARKRARKPVGRRKEKGSQGTRKTARVATEAPKPVAGHPADKPARKVFSSPKNLAEYREWVVEWLQAAKTAEEVRSQWSFERKLRNGLQITAEERAPIEALVGARIRELEGK